MDTFGPEDYTLEMGPMGPIGEGQALILRVNRNCPWNQCLFCSVYKGRNFSARSPLEIHDDIEAIRRIQELLDNASWAVGLQGRLRSEVAHEVVRSHPDIYGTYPVHITRAQASALLSLTNVARWLMNGATRVFLQDANALAMKQEPLRRILAFIKEAFPTVGTITCYARSRACSRRSLEELQALKEAGLSWAFVGIESGCDRVLQDMRKGVTTEEHISGGRKLLEAGVNMAAFVMPGLAGMDGDRSRRHISDTVAVLNEIQPTEIRVRSLALLEATPLYQQWESGAFKAPGEGLMIDELKRLIKGLSFDCTFETLQMTNPLFSMKGRLSHIRETMIEAIDWYQALSPIEQAHFLFHRFTEDGYLDFVKGWERYDDQLESQIENARISLDQGREDALETVSRLVFAIKSKGVP